MVSYGSLGALLNRFVDIKTTFVRFRFNNMGGSVTPARRLDSALFDFRYGVKVLIRILICSLKYMTLAL